MQQTVTKCDVCGKLKGEGNKWLHACRPLNVVIKTVVRYPIPSLGVGYGDLDICSEACMHKLVSEVIEEIRKEAEKDNGN